MVTKAPVMQVVRLSTDVGSLIFIKKMFTTHFCQIPRLKMPSPFQCMPLLVESN